jgi:cytochrome P450
LVLCEYATTRTLTVSLKDPINQTNCPSRIAGTHTTSATTTLLLYHLLHNPDSLAKCVAEIDNKLEPLSPDQAAYPVTVAESSLPYLRQCIKENFRLTPVFTMPLARRVIASEGIVIAGRHIKQGVGVPLRLRGTTSKIVANLLPSPNRHQ